MYCIFILYAYINQNYMLDIKTGNRYLYTSARPFKTDMYIYTFTHTHIYIYIYIYITERMVPYKFNTFFKRTELIVIYWLGLGGIVGDLTCVQFLKP